jgi:hypothetical protein
MRMTRLFPQAAYNLVVLGGRLLDVLILHGVFFKKKDEYWGTEMQSNNEKACKVVFDCGERFLLLQNWYQIVIPEGSGVQ